MGTQSPNGNSGLPPPLLPASFVPYLVGFGALAATINQYAPPNTLANKISGFVLAFMPALAALSPGWRKQ